MFQEKGERPLKKEMICSAVLHLIFFSYGIVFSLFPKPERTLLVGVEIAGESDLMRAMNVNQGQQEAVRENLLQQQEQEMPREMPQTQAENRENPQSAQPEEVSPPSSANDNEDTTAQPELPKEEKAEEDKGEAVPREKIKKEKKNPEKEQKKTEKKREKKTNADVIKKAKAKKQKWRDKIRDLAQKSEKKKEDDDFNKMLSGSMNDLKKIPSGKSGGKSSSGNSGGGFGFGGTGSGGAFSEGDAEKTIGPQIYNHWVVPSGIKDAEKFIIEIKVRLKDNGEVIPSAIEIIDQNRYASDRIFKAAADSARRAILEASPLRIPRDKAEMFREFIFRFNVKEALGL